MNNRKTIRKDATKKIANHISNATKILIDDRYIDITDSSVTSTYEISKAAVHEFIETNYYDLRVTEIYGDTGKLESVEISRNYTYSDIITLTFEEVQEVQEVQEVEEVEEVAEETQETQQVEDVKGVSTQEKRKITYEQCKKLLQAGWISPLHNQARRNENDINIDAVLYEGEWMTLSEFNRVCYNIVDTESARQLNLEFKSSQMQKALGAAEETVKWILELSIINEYLQDDVNRTLGHFEHIRAAA